MRLADTFEKVSDCPLPIQAEGELVKEKNVAALTDDIGHPAPNNIRPLRNIRFIINQRRRPTQLCANLTKTFQKSMKIDFHLFTSILGGDGPTPSRYTWRH